MSRCDSSKMIYEADCPCVMPLPHSRLTLTLSSQLVGSVCTVETLHSPSASVCCRCCLLYTCLWVAP